MGLSFLPVYIMFVILIYRLTKAASIHRHSCSCSEWEPASGPASPAGLVAVILIFAELQYASK